VGERGVAEVGGGCPVAHELGDSWQAAQLERSASVSRDVVPRLQLACNACVHSQMHLMSAELAALKKTVLHHAATSAPPPNPSPSSTPTARADLSAPATPQPASGTAAAVADDELMTPELPSPPGWQVRGRVHGRARGRATEPPQEAVQPVCVGPKQLFEADADDFLDAGTPRAEGCRHCGTLREAQEYMQHLPPVHLEDEHKARLLSQHQSQQQTAYMLRRHAVAARQAAQQLESDLNFQETISEAYKNFRDICHITESMSETYQMLNLPSTPDPPHAHPGAAVKLRLGATDDAMGSPTTPGSASPAPAAPRAPRAPRLQRSLTQTWSAKMFQ